MSSSTYQGVTRIYVPDIGIDDPLHTDMIREGLADTLLHLDDQDGQCRCAWVAESTAKFRTTGTPAAVNTYYPITIFGPWSISLKANGTPFTMVVRIAGSSDAQTFAVKFRAVLSTLRDAPAALAIGGADTLTTATTTANMTAGWLADAAATNLVTLTDVQARNATQSVATLDALAGDPATVSMCLVYLHLYGSTANTASTPQLCGVYAREYVGL